MINAKVCFMLGYNTVVRFAKLPKRPPELFGQLNPFSARSSMSTKHHDRRRGLLGGEKSAGGSHTVVKAN